MKVERYLNGLKWAIQDELSFFSLTSLHSYFQMARKVEYMLMKKGDTSSKGRDKGRDFKGNSRGGSSGRTNDQKGYGKSK